MFETEIKSLKSLNHYLQRLVESRLWLKVIIALFLGVGFGLLLSPQNGWVSKATADMLGNWLALPGMLFLKLVQMIMIPLIVASIITGIASNDKENLKKLGGGVLLYFISTTIISVTIGTLLAALFRPGKYLHQQAEMDHANALADTAESSELSFGINDIPNAITDLLPENPLASMVSGEMLSIVIFTIIIGVAVLSLPNDLLKPVKLLLSAVQEICMTVVKWAMLLVPVAVFGLMAQLTSSVGLSSLSGLGFYVLVVLLGLFMLIVIYLLLVSTLGRTNPLKFLRKITDVQLLAFSTTSSAAVMPLSLKTAEEELKVDSSISNFIIPIGATVNMDGTALYQTITTLFIAQAYGLEMDLLNIIVVVVTIVAASIGTPAIPGGGVVILASVLSGAGIPSEGIIIIIGVERLLGMFRTAVNVTGDLTACMVFNRFYGKIPDLITANLKTTKS
ncbi:dicarboxylate/amino acid:cation symporter [Muricauda oceani]|jgi:Na+/H+-dicarboxylate symporter|uniref:Dicarboxylate/amino acid:cation symporter n=3 Tax=Flagellimonas TaxID=444459 RepID=A0A371JVN4_9FLAO|nr:MULTISPECIES: dicarboxylate/amino acid:cation symporter [Allomuricauda]MBO6534289.1 dicarboxylate/amino acid:cation symporter [Allomuricauda sp.]MBO6589741.1 dicarboxylate/amino acid:cation symporter [Allomuricauda sp.]MBO6619326.1 dicarboxylate/amino acid:cation symporter [Allomuricauda sp.]MBO6645237.1 dicarboxylate/amino acid:cation symporter [Allomuricauda sp.]MBO6747487.1 dicarboxylate/amino acid:cation symporter [Allomuricauda sp.]|tara:strand:+ start:37925 stop:39274 length:1350 start_codon:yes stop_codon:yes gene_type:complete